MKRVSIFLITVALIGGMVSCIGVSSFTLTIDSTEGGSVTTPGEGTFTYFLMAQQDAVRVDLVAEAEERYRFVEWTGDVSRIDNVNAAITYIEICCRDCSITANFETDFMVAAGGYRTVGLKSDGTVVAVGDYGEGQCEVSGWTDITQVAAGGEHTVGLKDDGTVVAVGNNDYGQCNVGGWTLK